MKKHIALLLVVLMLLSFTACGSESTVPTPTEAPASTETPEEEPAEKIMVTFSTEDRDGNPMDESIFADYKLIMLNFWEPWCGPCVREMPDLQKLYENNLDRGVLLIGVYSTEEGVDKVLEETGVQYPMITYTDDFEMFMTGYVPTTIFVRGDGSFVAGPFVGGGTLDDWQAVVDALYEE